MTRLLIHYQGITGQGLFTGCLLAIPDWAYLSWMQPLIVESELILVK